MATYLLGIDNGSTTIKAAIFDTAGREIAVHGVTSSVHTPGPGLFERTLEEIWRANVEVIRGAIEKSGVDPADIACCAVTGHGGGVHMVDARGAAVYPAMEGVDTRAAGVVSRWMADGTFDRVHSRVMQSWFPAQQAPLLRWLVENEPNALEKALWILSIKDYVRYRLTGEAFSEITSSSASGMMNVRDARWDAELLDELGIRAILEKLPPLKLSADLCGAVCAETSRLTGLREGMPVAGGMWDVDSAAIATGVLDDGMLNIVAGTWSNNQFVSRTPVVSKSIFMTTVFAVPGFWLMLEGSPTSASNLEWFVKELMGEERQQAAQAGSSVYEICNREVASTTAAENVPVFLPFLYGSNAGADAQGAFLGLNGQHRRAHLLRAVYEGVAFSHRTHIEKLAAVHALPKAARIAGGVSGSPVWVQMFADVLQLSVECISAHELGALGCAITAGVACGIFPSYEKGVQAMVRVSCRVEPDAAAGEAYEKKYRRYRAAAGAAGSFGSTARE
ncbi:MAG: FGGY-family carbohydrate kinase [Spirochaetia bacterium]|jgi:L-xylulokinase